MYFALGGHPGINVPLEDGLRFEDYALDFRACAPQRVEFTPDCFVTGRKTPFALQNGKLPLCHALFDQDAIVLKGTTGTVTLASERGKPRRALDRARLSDFRLLAHAEDGRAIRCLEPWSSLPSRSGVIEDLKTQPDLICLPAGRFIGRSGRSPVSERAENDKKPRLPDRKTGPINGAICNFETLQAEVLRFKFLEFLRLRAPGNTLQRIVPEAAAVMLAGGRRRSAGRSCAPRQCVLQTDSRAQYRSIFFRNSNCIAAFLNSWKRNYYTRSRCKLLAAIFRKNQTRKDAKRQFHQKQSPRLRRKLQTPRSMPAAHQTAGRPGY